MPFTFTVTGITEISTDDFLRIVALDDIRFDEEYLDPRGKMWPQGGVRAYRANLSIRAVLIQLTDRTIKIKVPTLACEDDYELAIRATAAFAALSKVAVQDDESAGLIEVQEFLELRNSEWISKRTEAEFLATAASYRDRDNVTLSFPGVSRKVSIGQKTLRRAESLGGDVRESVYHVIRRMNYLEHYEPDCWAPSFISITGSDKTAQTEMSLVLMRIVPDKRNLISLDARYLAVTSALDEKRIANVPIKDFCNLVASDLDWLDDRTFIAPILREEFLERLVQKYEGQAIDYEELTSKKNSPTIPLSDLRVFLGTPNNQFGLAFQSLPDLLSNICRRIEIDDGQRLVAVEESEVIKESNSQEELYQAAIKNTITELRSTDSLAVVQMGLQQKDNQEVRACLWHFFGDILASSLVLGLEQETRFPLVGKFGTIFSVPAIDDCYVLPIDGPESLKLLTPLLELSSEVAQESTNKINPMPYWYHPDGEYYALRFKDKQQLELPEELQSALDGKPLPPPRRRKAEVASEQGSSTLSVFTADELTMLELAPLVAFFAIANADGEIDQKERDALSHALNDQFPDVMPLFREILRSSKNRIGARLYQLEGIMLDAKRSEHSVRILVSALQAVADRVSYAEAVLFGETLVDFGKYIAESSSGRRGLFRRRISKEEQKGLAILEQLMDAAISSIRAGDHAS
jgi:hypothetical protein